MTYGLHNALTDVIRDLRDYDDLVDLLEAADAIGEGWPRDEQEHPIAVRVQPITESSSHMGAATERTFRIQFSAVATSDWRKSHPAPTHRMAEIMARIADRLDVGAQSQYAEPGEVAAGELTDVTGDRVALIQDWRITVRQRR